MQHSRALAPGTVIARDWRIEGMLGQGGFGVTYEARHRSSGVQVALKEYMPSGLCSRPEGTAKLTPAPGPAGDVFKRGLAGFMKEAETLARLDHPSIVRVTGFFEANSTAYMALAFETGGTLSDWLKRLGRRPTQVELERLLWSLTDALREVHALFVLHRDIKPDNIMLRGDGTPVLIDFGAVKNIVSSETRSIGAPGTLNFVTDGYAPPEQYVPDGESLLGPWTDVYSLGATIYEVMTGTRPPVATRRMIDESYRPLAGLPQDRLAAGWRPALLEGIDKALLLRRSDRPQSMMEFRRAIGLVEAPRPPAEAVAGRSPTQAVPTRSDGSSARPVTFEQFPALTNKPDAAASSKTSLGIAAALAAALLAGGALWIMQQQAGKVDPALQKAEADRRIAEAKASQLEGEARARRIVAEKAAEDAAAKAEVDVEARRIVTDKAKAEEAEQKRVATEAKRRAEEGARRRDPIATLAPGSGQSSRDRLKDGSECRFCPDMVVVPAGRFMMGSPQSEAQRVADEVQVPVTVSRPFAIGKFAVTFDQWDACVADGACNGHKPADEGWGRGRRPVINVNWDDAKAFAEWLSRRTGAVYRLPSEAEREYVTRAGTSTPYWWGSSISSDQANFDGRGLKGEYRQRTVPVDSFKPNPWGLYNVHGNINEWTEDDEESSNRASENCWPSSHRLRGGSWFDHPGHLRAGYRNCYDPKHRDKTLGFRLARTLPP